MITPYSNIISVTTLSSLLLDTYSGAAAAYSLRKLRSAYTGSAIRVRRSSDNTEQDIGFVNNELDTSTLTSFCSGTNGFVKTWYDQSGNGRDATQATAANQPQIVSSGSVLITNGKPRIDFDGTDDFLPITSFNYASSNYNSFVGRRTASGRILMALGGNQYNFALWSDNNYYLQASSSGYQSSTSTDTSTSQLLLTGLRESGGNQKIYKNASEISSKFNSLSLGLNITQIGRYLTLFEANCELQEIVYYNSDQSSNRTGIETNINTYYSIY